MKIFNYTILLILSEFFSLSVQAIDARLCQPDPAQPNYNRPNYGNLETVVRLKSASGQGACYYEGYKGSQLMFETRDMHTKQFAWAATVAFSEKRQEALCDGGGNFLSKPIAKFESQVILEYTYYPGYSDIPHIYGDEYNVNRYPERDDHPFKIKFRPSSHSEDNGNTLTSRYKSWLTSCFFEWTLPNPLTIKNLIAQIEQLKIGNQFPYYFFYGYSADGGCLNCVTFSMVFLQRIGVNINVSPLIRSYIDSYLERTNFGKVTEGAAIIGAGGAAVVGGLQGASVGASYGASVGLIGGPWGAAAGGFAGGLIGGVGGAVASWWVTYKVEEVVARNAVHAIPTLTCAAKPYKFVQEIFNVRNNCGNLRIVQTRNAGAILANPFLNQELLRLLSMNAFPNGVNYANYQFYY